MVRYERRINGRSAYVCLPTRLNVHYGAYLIVILLNFYMCFQKYRRSCCLIEKTLNYIKQNLNADLSLEKIAKITSYTQKFTRLNIYSRVNFCCLIFMQFIKSMLRPCISKALSFNQAKIRISPYLNVLLNF